jgi:hypothetical protein
MLGLGKREDDQMSKIQTTSKDFCQEFPAPEWENHPKIPEDVSSILFTVQYLPILLRIKQTKTTTWRCNKEIIALIHQHHTRPHFQLQAIRDLLVAQRAQRNRSRSTTSMDRDDFIAVPNPT